MKLKAKWSPSSLRTGNPVPWWLNLLCLIPFIKYFRRWRQDLLLTDDLVRWMAREMCEEVDRQVLTKLRIIKGGRA